jgi:hypothetical protein
VIALLLLQAAEKKERKKRKKDEANELISLWQHSTPLIEIEKLGSERTFAYKLSNFWPQPSNLYQK